MRRTRPFRRARFAALGGGFVLPLLLAACGPRPAPLPPGALAVELAFRTNRVGVGEAVTVELTADYPAGSTVMPPAPGAPWVVRQRTVSDRAGATGRRRATFRYELIGFEPGAYPVFTNRVAAVSNGVTVAETALPGPALEVVSVLDGVTNRAPAPPKPPMDWPRAWPAWTWALPLVAALAFAVGWLARRWWRRRAARESAGAPSVPPHEKALAALRALAAAGWPEPEGVEPFYVALSDIARHYLEERFGLRAPESTTEEFLRGALASRRLSTDHRELARGFLEECDLVKFARHRPARADLERAWRAAERLVRETIPTAAPDGGAGGGA